MVFINVKRREINIEEMEINTGQRAKSEWWWPRVSQSQRGSHWVAAAAMTCCSNAQSSRSRSYRIDCIAISKATAMTMAIFVSGDFSRLGQQCSFDLAMRPWGMTSISRQSTSVKWLFSLEFIRCREALQHFWKVFRCYECFRHSEFIH